MRVFCLCDWTLVLLTSRCESEGEKGVKNLHLRLDDWWWGKKLPFFTNYGPIFFFFLLLAMHRRLKWSLYFTNGRTKWFKTFVIMTYFGVKNPFLLQQESVNLGKERGRQEAHGLSIREKEEKVGRENSLGSRVGFFSLCFDISSNLRLFCIVQRG